MAVDHAAMFTVLHVAVHLSICTTPQDHQRAKEHTDPGKGLGPGVHS